MRLFARRRLPEAGDGYSGPPAAAMRGRATEIGDAGAVPWQVLWEALKIAAPGEHLTSELGLRMDDWTDGTNEPMSGQRMFGVRHGRQVEIRIGHTTRGLNVRMVQVTWVRAATPECALKADDGVLVADHGALAEVVSGFAPSRAWDGIELRGGPEGLVARRPTSTRGQNAGWAYDLWLCERVARALGSPLPHAELERATIPYGMG
jgi:hypothetical protein